MTGHKDIKECFSLFPTGVMIAATGYQEKYFGLTINSFSSVSLEPELVLFSIGSHSYNLDAFKNSDSYILNMMANSQLELAKDFASHDHDRKWINADFTATKNSNPLFKNSLGFIECKHHKIIEAGDHNIFIGEVIDFAKLSEEDALQYYKGSFIS